MSEQRNARRAIDSLAGRLVEHSRSESAETGRRPITAEAARQKAREIAIKKERDDRR